MKKLSTAVIALCSFWLVSCEKETLASNSDTATIKPTENHLSITNGKPTQIKFTTQVPIEYTKYLCNGELIHFTGVITIKMTGISSDNRVVLNEIYDLSSTGATPDGRQFVGSEHYVFNTNYSNTHYSFVQPFQVKYREVHGEGVNMVLGHGLTTYDPETGFVFKVSDYNLICK